MICLYLGFVYMCTVTGKNPLTYWGHVRVIFYQIRWMYCLWCFQ